MTTADSSKQTVQTAYQSPTFCDDHPSDFQLIRRHLSVTFWLIGMISIPILGSIEFYHNRNPDFTIPVWTIFVGPGIALMSTIVFPSKWETRILLCLGTLIAFIPCLMFTIVFAMACLGFDPMY